MGNKIKYAVTQFENNVDFIPEYIEGNYDIPFIKPERYEDEVKWIPFNQSYSAYKREEKGIHFFIYDYCFTALWNKREKYKDMLPQFKAIMTPDFSLYVDWPKMVQMWNHYRKHQLGAWMQSIGCKVYPTIRWADKSSFKWCFDGEPYGSTVCVSSMGMTKDKEMQKLFMLGYDRMLEVLNPETILFYGIIPLECQGNIIPIEPFYKKFNKERDEDDQT